MIVARDSAHGKLRERLEKGEPLPDYFKEPSGVLRRSGQDPGRLRLRRVRPTTAGRMDSFVDQFQAAGRSMVIGGEGQRAVAVREACRSTAASISGSIGGAAAKPRRALHQEGRGGGISRARHEAVWRIEVADFPAFIHHRRQGQ